MRPISLKFPTSCFLSLKAGAMFAFLQSPGSSPDHHDLSNMTEHGFAMTLASSICMQGCIPSQDASYPRMPWTWICPICLSIPQPHLPLLWVMLHSPSTLINTTRLVEFGGQTADLTSKKQCNVRLVMRHWMSHSFPYLLSFGPLPHEPMFSLAFLLFSALLIPLWFSMRLAWQNMAGSPHLPRHQVRLADEWLCPTQGTVSSNYDPPLFCADSW